MRLRDAALALGRRSTEATMSERVLVGTEADGTDEHTGDATTVLIDVVYGQDGEGIGQVKYVADTVSLSSGAGQVASVQRPILKVPTGTPLLDQGKAVWVASSTVDGLLVGRRYQIAGVPEAGSTTAHRYPLTELS